PYKPSTMRRMVRTKTTGRMAEIPFHRSTTRRLGPLLAVLATGPLAVPAGAQTVSGIVFEDRNGNGVRDAGEPALPGVPVEVFGRKDAGGAFDQTAASG